MALNPEKMLQSMLDNLPEKTGKTIAQWTKIIKKTDLTKHGEMVNFLKKEHGVTHGFANVITHHARDTMPAPRSDNSDDKLVAVQYSGPKEALKPIYDAILKQVTAFGSDVEIAPKKAYVSLRRKKQFTLIQPTTKTRVDVGINIKGKKPEGRLEAAGSFNTMVSHRVRLEDQKQVNAELKKWLKEAYDAAG